MVQRKQCVVCVAAVTCLLIFICSLLNNDTFMSAVPKLGKLSSSWSTSSVDTQEQFPVSTLPVPSLHKVRLDILHKACENRQSRYTLPATPNDRETLSEFLVDVRHGLVYCYIPKVGSSTMKRVFNVLAGKNRGQSLFDISGREIHWNREGKYDVFGHVMKNESLTRKYEFLRKSKKVVFVRDPYERIFSAYVDRLFGITETLSPLLSEIFKDSKDYTSCGMHANLTFTDVIRYVTDCDAWKLDEHFRPYYSICFPCHVDYDYVGKMETFRDDVESVLTSLGVDPLAVLGDDERFDVSNEVATLRDVVKRTFEMFRTIFDYLRCYSKYRMLKRTWVSFQIRGYLSLTTPFPITPDEAEAVTLTQFDLMVKDAYGQIKDRNSVKEQRQIAVQEAYHSVPRELLYKLQTVVQADCDLFGYECSIDTRFPKSGYGPPVFHFNDL